MNKILIVAFYELKDYMLNIKESFEKFNYLVYDYPLFRYAYDAHDKIQNYQEHMNKYIKEVSPDIILWWFIDVHVDVFAYIKKNNTNIYFIMYNCDEVLNMSSQLLEKSKIFDLLVTVTKENYVKYKVHSKVNNILYNIAGYDPEYFHPITYENNEDENIYCECDISMICYNLYLDTSYYNSQYIDRKKMIDDVIKYCNDNKKTFKLFGAPILREYYKDHYMGEISYIKMNNLYNRSKININTHSFCNKTQYLNEQTMQILGSGGLMVIDKVKDIEKILLDGVHCIYLKKTDYIKQIDEILKNYSKYDDIKKNAVNVAQNYTWYQWVKKIHIEISKKMFDAESYKEINNITDITDPWIHWLKYGLENNHISHNVKVPESFQYQDYADKIGSKEKSKKKLYVHWFTHSKDNIYIIEKESTLSLDTNNYFITNENFFVFGNICNMISTHGTLDQGFELMDKFSKSHPYTDINILLENYLKMTN